MSLYTAGYNGSYELGIIPGTEALDKNTIIKSPTKSFFDVSIIRCISSGWQHTVIVTKLWRLYVTGDDTDFKIGTKNRKIYKNFTEVSIFPEKIAWAACGTDYTLYLTEYERIFLCHNKSPDVPIQINTKRKPIAVFGGKFYGSIVDEVGSFYLLDKENPHKLSNRYMLNSPVVEMCCCSDFVLVLTASGDVFGNGKLNNDEQSFALVKSLSNLSITKISGYAYSALALDEDGFVYSYGSNQYGQLGNGTKNNSFTDFQMIEAFEDIKIVDIACSYHSLFLDNSGQIYGCGNNLYAQLVKPLDRTKILLPEKLELNSTISSMCVGNSSSFFFNGAAHLENPAKLYFLNPVTYIQEFSVPIFQIIQPMQNKVDELEAKSKEHMEKISDLNLEIQELRRQNKELEDKYDEMSNKINKILQSISIIDNSNSVLMNEEL